MMKLDLENKDVDLPIDIIDLDLKNKQVDLQTDDLKLDLENKNTENLIILKETEYNEKEFKILILNGYSLLYSKKDRYIDVTNFFKASEKIFTDWFNLDNTKCFIKLLSDSLEISDYLLIKSVKDETNNIKLWVYPQIAINIAQWISPEFEVKVTRWVFEIMINQQVEIDKEKTNKYLENMYIEKISDIKTQLELNKEQYSLLLKKHNSTLKTHRYVKFKENDPCFYIIESGIICDCGKHNSKFKFGIAGTDEKNRIDDRLQSHRTLWPLLKVRFLLFIKDVEIIEKSIKMIYEKEINPNGHEIIEGVELTDIINSIQKLFGVLCIKNYHIMPNEKLKQYNDYVDTIVKE